jgi:hypothetical protein
MLNIGYLFRVFSLSQNRRPHLAQQVVMKNGFWAKHWKRTGNRYDVVINFEAAKGGGADLRSLLTSMVEGERALWRSECQGRARTSVYHQQLLSLSFDLGDKTFLSDKYDITIMSWTIKARAELINLNFKPWLPNQQNNCSLCNLQQLEDVFHFTAICPIWSGIRVLFWMCNFK